MLDRNLSLALAAGAFLALAVARAARAEPTQASPLPVAESVKALTERVDPVLPSDPGAAAPRVYPIDLGTALALADSANPQIRLARERIRQALAQQQQASVLWLPSLRAGVTWSRHDGTLQETVGRVLEVDRNSLEAGLGAAAFGAGPPMLPGLSADFHLADAIFLPLAARQATAGRRAASAAVTNDVLLAVAVAYLDLLRAYQEISIAIEASDNNGELARITAEYARVGKGLKSDADRVAAEQAIRAADLERAKESVAVASAVLAQRLHLDPAITLVPLEEYLVPIELVDPAATSAELIARALASRPELVEVASGIAEARQRLNREKFAPLLPNFSLGASYGGFGGGEGASMTQFDDRVDLQGIAYWQVRNLGLGDRAARRDRQSQLRQAALGREVVADQVAREVVEAHARTVARRRLIEIAREGIPSAVASYHLNRKRIEGAQGLPIEVLQAIQALALARREYLRAIIDYSAAQFALRRALGEPPIPPPTPIVSPPAASATSDPLTETKPASP